MIPLIMVTIALLGLGFGTVYMGILITRATREQFDELLSQRMVDYSGFIDANSSRD